MGPARCGGVFACSKQTARKCYYVSVICVPWRGGKVVSSSTTVDRPKTICAKSPEQNDQSCPNIVIVPGSTAAFLWHYERGFDEKHTSQNINRYFFKKRMVLVSAPCFLRPKFGQIRWNIWLLNPRTVGESFHIYSGPSI